MDEFIKSYQDVVKESEITLNRQKNQSACTDSKESSTSLRKKANTLYKTKRNLQSVVELYTRAVKAAEYDSEDLALALGNRSAVTFELKQYKLCVKDIKSALSLSSINSALMKRLLIREAKCWHYLCDLPSFTEVYQRVTDGSFDLTSSESECLAQMTNNFLPVLKSNGETSQGVYGSANPTLSSASDCIKMKVSGTKGRYIQMTEDVAAGSTLISEEPYVSVLLPDYWSTHCYHCLSDVSSTPLFCKRKGCAVSYCSLQCQRLSYETYHQYECLLLDTIVNTGIGHLAYRVIAFTGYDVLMAHRDKTPADAVVPTVAHKDKTPADAVVPTVAHKDKTRDDAVVPTVAHKDKTPADKSLGAYAPVYDLVTNAEHILPGDLFQYQKTALLLLLCLLETHFFPLSVKSLSHPDVLYIGSLLLRHILQLVCNAHAITVVGGATEVKEANKLISQTQNKLASAIYPTASLVNHSCKPNIIASFVGSTLIVKNSVDLKKGDEVYNCYGPHYQKMERDERQRSLLTQYHFTCDCEACTDNSSSVSLKSLCCVKCMGRALLISETEARCEQCTAVYDASNQIQRLIRARQLLDEAKSVDYSRGLMMTRDARQILSDGVVHKFSIELANAYDQEAQIAAASGDMASCARCLQSGIEIIERLYPENSVELAHEYHKLSEVLCNTCQYGKALRYANKARTIFSRQYSASHDLVQEVDLLCRQIQMVNI